MKTKHTPLNKNFQSLENSSATFCCFKDTERDTENLIVIYGLMMKKIYPTELIDFLQCRHRITLKKAGIEGDDSVSEEVELLRQKGLEHEQSFLESLDNVVVIDSDLDKDEQSRLTLEAIEEGAPFIYQAFLEHEGLAGYPDFMERVDQEDKSYSYRILDTKLSKVPTASNAVQLIHYAGIAEKIQKKPVTELVIVHGDNSRSSISKADFDDYYKELLEEYRLFYNGHEETEPYPVNHCRSCQYRSHCENYWQEKDHLASINGIRPYQIAKLQESGTDTVKSLSEAAWKESLGISESVFASLKKQALAQRESQLILKNAEAFDALKALKNGGLILTFFKNTGRKNGASLFYTGIKVTPGNRVEEIFINSADEEARAFGRMINFIMRFIDKRPHSHLFVWSLADIKAIHDLSNRYNICHDEVDELVLKKKIISVQAALTNAVYFPVSRNSLESFYQILESDPLKHESLSRSPIILNELWASAGVEDAEKMISERAVAELNAMEFVLSSVTDYEKSAFPVKLSCENIEE